MHSKKAWLVIIPAVSVVLVAVVCFLYRPLYYRFYFGDRIKGEVQVAIDGKAALFDEERTNEHWNNEGDFSITDHTAMIALTAGDYGMYDFQIYVIGMDQPVQISVMQFNWWNVHTFCLHVAVDTNTNTAIFTYSSTNVSEAGDVYTEEGTKEVDLTQEELFICL